VLQLTRYAQTTGPDGLLAETIGRLAVIEDGTDVWSCRTIELPFRGNERWTSCIPPGRYVAEVVQGSPAFGYPHVWVHDRGSRAAAGTRTGIKIHVANYARQLEGCIAVGRKFRDLDGDGVVDVTNSEETLKDLIGQMPAKTELHALAPGELTTIPEAELDPHQETPLNQRISELTPTDV